VITEGVFPVQLVDFNGNGVVLVDSARLADGTLADCSYGLRNGIGYATEDLKGGEN
jgi:hypothetical protein